MSPEMKKGYSYRIVGFWATALSLFTVVFLGGMAANQNNADHSVLKERIRVEEEVNAAETRRSIESDNKTNAAIYGLTTEVRSFKAETKKDLQYLKEGIDELKSGR
jgi:hypothetical protein